jgi:peptidoglycan/xylan/chitin deacetylase (PgdA/CDA1 family)
VEPETFPDVASSPAAIAKYVISSVEPGSIVLLHVLGSKNQSSRDSIPLIVNGLRAKGYRFVTISNLLSENPYKQG